MRRAGSYLNLTQTSGREPQARVVLQKISKERNSEGSFLLSLGSHSKQASDEGDLPSDVAFGQGMQLETILEGYKLNAWLRRISIDAYT